MAFCSNCLNPIPKKDLDAIELIKKEYKKNNIPWYIGYSGGKDSSSVLSLVFNALLEYQTFHKPVKVIYCDTGVEIPVISNYVKSTIAALTKEASLFNLPVEFVLASPKISDRFFVKVIGRGYPPPTNIFRWCTDKLRINPVKSVIGTDENAIVLLGVRKGESNERDKTIKRHSTNSEHYLNQGSSSKTKIFSPIINYSIKDVWSTLKFNHFPKSIDFSQIGKLYKDAGAECPVFKEDKGTPCGKGRFGCWTCTVVRKDKSVASMVESGYEDLEALFLFRNWLSDFRSKTQYRCMHRRNGAIGLGPFTLDARKIILEELLKAQELSGYCLINQDEINEIHKYWELDKNNPKYSES